MSLRTFAFIITIVPLIISSLIRCLAHHSFYILQFDYSGLTLTIFTVTFYSMDRVSNATTIMQTTENISDFEQQKKHAKNLCYLFLLISAILYGLFETYQYHNAFGQSEKFNVVILMGISGFLSVF